ncbi:MAG TPA: hypothetical protein VFR84_11775 [Candidatus Angelobacter sp.]|nr:hypothetical protein [Candidatus Angelobacter sp.]
MIWWILGGIAAFFLLMILWGAGSYLYLKLHYHHLSEAERLRFSDLQKEEQMRQPDRS